MVGVGGVFFVFYEFKRHVPELRLGDILRTFVFT